MKSYTSKELHQMTVPDLKLLIRHHNIRNYSKMREQQLVNAKNLCQTSKIKKRRCRRTMPLHPQVTTIAAAHNIATLIFSCI